MAKCTESKVCEIESKVWLLSMCKWGDGVHVSQSFGAAAELLWDSIFELQTGAFVRCGWDSIEKHCGFGAKKG